VHRRHHAALDTVGDPHSPAVRGTSRVLLTNILMYRNAAKNPALVDRYTHDMPRTRPAAKSGTNGQVLALLTAGEGLHNNHHAVPTAARLSFGSGQFDPAWWFIRGLQRVHLVTLRHRGGVLAPR
jgi:fatty-acid desaturase